MAVNRRYRLQPKTRMFATASRTNRRTLNRLLCRVRRYEHFLHEIALCASVSMDGKRVGELIDNAISWSYAHRVGNGEISEDDQIKAIDAAFKRLLRTRRTRRPAA